MILHNFLIFIGFLLTIAIAPLARAQDQVLPAPVSAILDKAASRNDGANFVETVLLVMEAQPDEAMDVYNYAISIAPKQAETLSAAVSTSYPNLALAQPVSAVEEEQIADNEPPAETGFFNLDAWDGNVEAGGSYSTGNTEEKAASIGIGLKGIFSETWDHAIHLNLDYAQRTGVTTKQRFLADYQLYYRAWERAYLFTFLQYEDDRFSGFEYRALESFGGGYTIFDSDQQKWNIEGGPGLRQSKIEGESVNNELVAVLSSDYRYFFNENVNVGDNLKVFIGSDRTTIQNTADLVAKLNSSLSARLSFGVKYDSNVPVGSVRTDTITKATILYDF